MWLRSAIVAILSVMLVGAAIASDTDLDRCASDDPQIRIAACTKLIESGTQPADFVRTLRGLRGLGYFWTGDYAKAIPDITAALPSVNQREDISGMLRLRATSYLQLGDFTRAVADFSQSIQLVPDDAVSYGNRAYTLLKMKRYSDAISDYDVSLSQRPNVPQTLYGRGLAKQALGDQAGAEIDIAKAKAAEPSIADAF